MLSRRRWIALLAIALSMLAIPFTGTMSMAAIPCIEMDPLPATSEVVVATPEEPRSVEHVLGGPELDEGTGSPAVSADAIPADEPGGDVENIVRCLTYGDVATFATLVTGHYRTTHIGVMTPQEAASVMADSGSVVLLKQGELVLTEPARSTVDVELLVNGDRVLGVTLEFEHHHGGWYLADSRIGYEADVSEHEQVAITVAGAEPAELQVASDSVTRIDIENTLESSYTYTLVHRDADGARGIHHGFIGGKGIAGPPDDSIIVLHGIEPGTYELSLVGEGDQEETKVIMIEVLP